MNLTNEKGTASKGRLHHLDAMRGIAALSVVFSHVFGLNSELPQWGMLGGAAVTFFFLLSGYVLGKSLSASGSRPIEDALSYCVRRLFRLYPAIFVTLVVAAVLAKFYVIPEISTKLSPWFSKSLIKATQINGMYDYIGTFRLYYIRLDPPLWTIQIEFVCSLLLPLLIWPTKWHQISRWGLLLILGYWKFSNPVWMPVWMRLATHLFEFYLGYIAWTLFPMIAEISPRKSKYLIISCLIGSMVWIWFFDRSAAGIISILGLSAFLSFAGPGRWEFMQRKLNSPTLQFLGRISYSLYLIHLPILMFIWSIIYGKTKIVNVSFSQSIILLIAVLPASLMFSAAIECFVERPFNDYGHKISSSLKKLLQKYT